jgi:hypothetical protein
VLICRVALDCLALTARVRLAHLQRIDAQAIIAARGGVAPAIRT